MANVTTPMVEEMLKQGKSATEIAKHFGITRQGVYHHINKIKKREKPKPFPDRPKRDYNSMIDWKVYNEGLVKRGEILFDFRLFEEWNEELEVMNEGKRGRPYEFPDIFIQFLMRLKSIFKIDYRSVEGIARRLILFVPQAKRAPDYSTLPLRVKGLQWNLKVYQENTEQEIAGDATGLKTSNRGEYRMNKYKGEKKKFVKLHIAVNTKTRQVVGCSITEEERRDHEEMPNIISQAKKHGKITKGSFDAGYDTKDTYWKLKEENIKPVIKPRKTMKLERVKQVIEEERERIKTIKDKRKKKEIKKHLLRLNTLKKYLQDKERWKKESGYGERWKVEGRYSVFKRIFGEHVFSKKMQNIRNETVLKVSLMNLFASLTIGAIKTSLGV